ncbi:MAG: hypothetical protein V4613_02775 [Bacteroidota bacterium]
MTDAQENKLSMLQKVQAHYAHNSAAMAAIPALAALHTELTGYITTLLTLAGQTNADITGYTANKHNKRNALLATVIKINAAYAAWLYVNGQTIEAARFDQTPAMLGALRDNDLYTHAQDLAANAAPEAAQLAAFGIVPADFAALTAQSAVFLELIQSYKVQVSLRSAGLAQLDVVLTQAMQLVSTRLDNVMKVFIIPNPTLYDSYRFARSIDNTGAKKTNLYTNTLSPLALAMVVQLPYSLSRSYRVHNTGPAPLQAALSNTPTALQGRIAHIAPGDTLIMISKDYNTDTAAEYFLLQNVSETVAGSYEVEVG